MKVIIFFLKNMRKKILYLKAVQTGSYKAEVELALFKVGAGAETSSFSSATLVGMVPSLKGTTYELKLEELGLNSLEKGRNKADMLLMLKIMWTMWRVTVGLKEQQEEQSEPDRQQA